ncbi:hypothetical protein TIFTF001_019438 [Ficus carica]|uniref:Acyl-ACP thioesterase-like C-terminal domain-containing protein n=1 Tax=Ficus carica TaxID=3494 RepID=A0AA88ABQ1_FICCA|nr:hypothetical protein TIFTF001_019438 [Ficus carica]
MLFHDLVIASYFPEEKNSSLRKIPKLEYPAENFKKLGLVPRRADLDMNQHVNNVIYIDWVLEDDSDGDHLPCVVEEFNLPFALKVTKKQYPEFLSAIHCNGVICFYDAHHCSEETNVNLCNVELGEFKLLRTPRLQLEFSFAGAGFGYDPKADTYEGVYYWRSAGLQGSEHTVLSFDLSEEKFDTIKLPLIAQRPNRRFKRLTIWKQSAVFFISTERSHHSTSFEMWVMMVHDFNGVEGFTSWNKHLTIGSLVCIYSPLAFWKDDELLMQTRDGRIVSYNLHTQKFKELSIPGSLLPDSTRAFFMS